MHLGAELLNYAPGGCGGQKEGTRGAAARVCCASCVAGDVAWRGCHRGVGRPSLPRFGWCNCRRFAARAVALRRSSAPELGAAGSCLGTVTLAPAIDATTGFARARWTERSPDAAAPAFGVATTCRPCCCCYTTDRQRIAATGGLHATASHPLLLCACRRETAARPVAGLLGRQRRCGWLIAASLCGPLRPALKA